MLDTGYWIQVALVRTHASITPTLNREAHEEKRIRSPSEPVI